MYRSIVVLKNAVELLRLVLSLHVLTDTLLAPLAWILLYIVYIELCAIGADVRHCGE